LPATITGCLEVCRRGPVQSEKERRKPLLAVPGIWSTLRVRDKGHGGKARRKPLRAAPKIADKIKKFVFFQIKGRLKVYINHKNQIAAVGRRRKKADGAALSGAIGRRRREKE
jgi:hypothetical protein